MAYDELEADIFSSDLYEKVGRKKNASIIPDAKNVGSDDFFTPDLYDKTSKTPEHKEAMQEIFSEDLYSKPKQKVELDVKPKDALPPSDPDAARVAKIQQGIDEMKAEGIDLQNRGVWAKTWEAITRGNSRKKILNAIAESEGNPDAFKAYTGLLNEYDKTATKDPVKAETMVGQWWYDAMNSVGGGMAESWVKSLAIDLAATGVTALAVNIPDPSDALTAPATFLAMRRMLTGAKTAKEVFDKSRLLGRAYESEQVAEKAWRTAKNLNTIKNAATVAVVTEQWAKQGKGEILNEIKDMNLDPVQRNYISTIGGLIYGSIENLGGIHKLNPLTVGAELALKKAVKDKIVGAVGQAIGKYGIEVVKESFEESLQEFTTMNARNFAINRQIERDIMEGIDSDFNDPKYQMTSGGQQLNQAWQAFKSSLGPMVILGGAGHIPTIAATYMIQREKNGEKFTEEERKEEQDKAETTIAAIDQVNMNRGTDAGKAPKIKDIDIFLGYKYTDPQDIKKQADFGIALRNGNIQLDLNDVEGLDKRTESELKYVEAIYAMMGKHTVFVTDPDFAYDQLIGRNTIAVKVSNFARPLVRSSMHEITHPIVTWAKKEAALGRPQVMDTLREFSVFAKDTEAGQKIEAKLRGLGYKEGAELDDEFVAAVAESVLSNKGAMLEILNSQPELFKGVAEAFNGFWKDAVMYSMTVKGGYEQMIKNEAKANKADFAPAELLGEKAGMLKDVLVNAAKAYLASNKAQANPVAERTAETIVQEMGAGTEKDAENKGKREAMYKELGIGIPDFTTAEPEAPRAALSSQHKNMLKTIRGKFPNLPLSEATSPVALEALFNMSQGNPILPKQEKFLKEMVDAKILPQERFDQAIEVSKVYAEERAKAKSEAKAKAKAVEEKQKAEKRTVVYIKGEGVKSKERTFLAIDDEEAKKKVATAEKAKFEKVTLYRDKDGKKQKKTFNVIRQEMGRDRFIAIENGKEIPVPREEWRTEEELLAVSAGLPKTAKIEKEYGSVYITRETGSKHYKSYHQVKVSKATVYTDNGIRRINVVPAEEGAYGLKPDIAQNLDPVLWNIRTAPVPSHVATEADSNWVSTILTKRLLSTILTKRLQRGDEFTNTINTLGARYEKLYGRNLMDIHEVQDFVQKRLDYLWKTILLSDDLKVKKSQDEIRGRNKGTDFNGKTVWNNEALYNENEVERNSAGEITKYESVPDSSMIPRAMMLEAGILQHVNGAVHDYFRKNGIDITQGAEIEKIGDIPKAEPIETEEEAPSTPVVTTQAKPEKGQVVVTTRRTGAAPAVAKKTTVRVTKPRITAESLPANRHEIVKAIIEHRMDEIISQETPDAFEAVLADNEALIKGVVETMRQQGVLNEADGRDNLEAMRRAYNELTGQEEMPESPRGAISNREAVKNAFRSDYSEGVYPISSILEKPPRTKVVNGKKYWGTKIGIWLEREPELQTARPLATFSIKSALMDLAMGDDSNIVADRLESKIQKDDLLSKEQLKSLVQNARQGFDALYDYSDSIGLKFVTVSPQLAIPRADSPRAAAILTDEIQEAGRKLSPYQSLIQSERDGIKWLGLNSGEPSELYKLSKQQLSDMYTWVMTRKNRKDRITGEMLPLLAYQNSAMHNLAQAMFSAGMRSDATRLLTIWSAGRSTAGRELRNREDSAQQALQALNSFQLKKVWKWFKENAGKRIPRADAEKQFDVMVRYGMIPTSSKAEFVAAAMAGNTKDTQEAIKRQAAASVEDKLTRYFIKYFEKQGKSNEEAGKMAEAALANLYKQLGGSPLQKKDTISNPEVEAEYIRGAEIATATFYDKTLEYWKNSILSGPSTLIQNPLSNGIRMVYEMFLKLPVSLAMQGKFGTMSTTLKEVWGQVLGRAWKGAWDNAVETWKTEIPKLMLEGRGMKLDHDSKHYAIGKVMGFDIGRVFRLPYRILAVADEFAKAVIVRANLAQQAVEFFSKTQHQANRQNVQTFIDSNYEDTNSGFMFESLQKALELTWQNENEMAKGAIALRKNVPFADFLIPFITTPMNIISSGLRMSPLGIINMAVQGMKYPFRQGTYRTKDGQGFDRVKFSNDAAEQMLAWGTTMMIMALAGGDDDDDKDKNLPRITTARLPPRQLTKGKADFSRQVLPTMSIRIGGKWYDYSRIEPIATLLPPIIDALRAMRESKQDGEKMKHIAEAFGRTAFAMQDKSFLGSIADIVKASENPLDVANWASNFGASWTPNFIRQTMRQLDDFERDSAVKGEKWSAEWIQNFWKKQEFQMLPKGGIDSSPYPVVDYFGNDLRKDLEEHPSTDVVSKLMMVAGVFKARNVTQNKINMMMLNWNTRDRFKQDNWDRDGKAGREIFFELPDKTIDKVGRNRLGGRDNYILTDKQYYEYSKLVGKIFDDLTKNRSFDYDSPTIRDMVVLKKLRERATEVATRQMQRKLRYQ